MTYSGFAENGIPVEPEENLVNVSTFNGNCVLVPCTVYQKVGSIDHLFHQ